MSKDNWTEEPFVRLYFLIIALVILAALIQPCFEARTFNRFTKGEKATYWDALFAELRIQAE